MWQWSAEVVHCIHLSMLSMTMSQCPHCRARDLHRYQVRPKKLKVSFPVTWWKTTGYAGSYGLSFKTKYTEMQTQSSTPTEWVPLTTLKNHSETTDHSSCWRRAGVGLRWKILCIFHHFQMKLVGPETGILKSNKISRTGPLKLGSLRMLETGNYFSRSNCCQYWKGQK